MILGVTLWEVLASAEGASQFWSHLSIKDTFQSVVPLPGAPAHSQQQDQASHAFALQGEKGVREPSGLQRLASLWDPLSWLNPLPTHPLQVGCWSPLPPSVLSACRALSWEQEGPAFPPPPPH